MEHFIVVFIAEFFIYFLFAGLLILWSIDGKIKKEQVIHAIFASFIAWLIARFIKILIPTVRPFIVDGNAAIVLFRPNDGSFPSEHTVIAFALAVTVFLHDRKVGWLFLLTALLIGIARVFANVHYPIDILGGAFLGTLVALVIEKTHFLDLASRSVPKRQAKKRRK